MKYIDGCDGLWDHFIHNLIGLLQQMSHNLSSGEEQFEIHKVSDLPSNALVCRLQATG